MSVHSTAQCRARCVDDGGQQEADGGGRGSGRGEVMVRTATAAEPQEGYKAMMRGRRADTGTIRKRWGRGG